MPSAYEDDVVRLVVGGKEINIATGYEIHQSVLEQPGSFSISLGQDKSIRDLISKDGRIFGAPFAPNTPFELYIRNSKRMTGRLDGFRVSQSGSSATQITVIGRDTLAPVHDAKVAADISFTDATYKSLVSKVLEILGLDPSKLSTSGTADRQLKAGVPIRELIPARTVEEILKEVGENQTTGSTHQSLQAKIGMRWLDFIRKQLDRAGLFLWGGGDGTIILSAPNSNLGPIYRIVRKRGQTRNDVNVEAVDYLYDTRPMYSFAIVYGKFGKQQTGFHKSKGDSADDIMLNLGFGINRAEVIHDKFCQTTGQAQYLAQRKLAEGRRHGFQLVYTVAGHSTPAIGGGRAIWCPDTVVEVDDDELGIKDVFWIDSVDFRMNPFKNTTIRLMRTYDVVFGTPDFEGTNGSGVVTGFNSPNLPQTAEEILEAEGEK